MADFNSLKPLHPGSVTYVSAEEGVKELEAEFAREDEEKRKRELEEKRNPKKEQKPEVQEPSASKVITLDNYLRLENISCTDANGNVFEQYPELYVRKDVYRDPKNKILYFTFFGDVRHAAAQGDFAPSFALTCNILAALYAQRSNPEADLVLKQYLDKGNKDGYHGQNTIIDFGAETVIHYPDGRYFGRPKEVNVGKKRAVLPFRKERLEIELLETALNEPDKEKYLRQLTGLRDLRILAKIGTYFDAEIKLWFPWGGCNSVEHQETVATWLGYNIDNFFLGCKDNLYPVNTLRGVREK